jgi:uncharacterized transporter YbjL
MYKKLVLLLSFLSLIATQSFSQAPDIEKTFHESGKIYVVVAVLTIIFLGLIYFLVRMEKKITKLEKNNKQ